ncbi:MAG: hypothetical protein MZU97_12305 [Bacillus subtilis]|nr:hypothetical protein [Bacillus subtilis]
MKEILYQGTEINAYVHARGGVLFELDSLEDPENLANAFGRYEELDLTVPWVPEGDVSWTGSRKPRGSSRNSTPGRRGGSGYFRRIVLHRKGTETV